MTGALTRHLEDALGQSRTPVDVPQRGWMEADSIHTREPTMAERREVLARLQQA